MKRFQQYVGLLFLKNTFSVTVSLNILGFFGSGETRIFSGLFSPTFLFLGSESSSLIVTSSLLYSENGQGHYEETI